MGCDGGTIPKRDELVKTKKKPEQKDKDAENVAKWKHCALSQEELRLPVVSCDLGRLYNKDAVIEHLLNKSQTSDLAKHIRSLKDVIELKLTENASFVKDTINKGDEYMDHQKAPFICPVVGMEMNGKYKFVYLRGCGCVLSERALKLVKSETCHKCGKAYNEDEIVTINGTDDEVAALREQMEARRLKSKMEKKAKKHKIEEKSSSSGEEKSSTSGEEKSSTSGESSLTTTKKTKFMANSLTNGFKPSDFTTKSIAKDKSKSDAYKSLFTSHESYKNQPKAHWITYNPLYN